MTSEKATNRFYGQYFSRKLGKPFLQLIDDFDIIINHRKMKFLVKLASQMLAFI